MILNTANQPLVTIYIPTYNRVELLRRAVNSVLNQSYQNIELIVVDDCSTDETHEYLEKTANEDCRFKYFINENNSGACVSRNRAIFSAKGEFITGLDDDDFFLPNRISSFVKDCKLLEEKCIALYSHVYLKASNNNSFIKRKKIKSCTSKQLMSSNWIGNQIFTKTEYLRQIGGFDKDLPAWQDKECWHRLLKFYESKAILVPEYSYVVDISHEKARISTQKESSILKAYDIYCDKHNLSRRNKTLLKLHLNAYTSSPVELLPIIYSFLNQPDLINSKRTLSILRNKLKRTIQMKINK